MAKLHITPDQEAALHDFYQYGDLADLAEQLQMSEVDVHRCARALGLSRAHMPQRWTDAQDELIRKHYPAGDVDELCVMLGRNQNAVKQRARGIGVRRPRRSHQWSEEQDDYLRANYTNGVGTEMAAHLGVSPCVLYRRAWHLGLEKAPDFYSQYAKKKGLPQLGAKHGFKKGNVPPNKGKRLSTELYRKLAPTMFKKGQVCRNKMPIGSTRINADGYLDRKVMDTGYPPADWQAVHRLLWVEQFGPIPDGHIICFKPGTKTTEEKAITIDILECITKKERMARNTVHRLPQDVKEVVYALGNLKRTINRRTKKAHDQEERHQ